MKMTFRWYGSDSDKITLKQIKQIPGCTGLMGVLDYKAAGEVWEEDEIKKYIDEVGTMNVMFVIGDEVITPELSGTILPGITRDSILTMLRDWGVKATERRITLDELQKAAKDGTLREAFGVGTAAVISPIGEFNIHGVKYTVGNGGIGLLSQKIYNALTDIQWGRTEDKYGWTVEVK